MGASSTPGCAIRVEEPVLIGIAVLIPALSDPNDDCDGCSCWRLYALIELLTEPRLNQIRVHSAGALVLHGCQLLKSFEIYIGYISAY